MKSFLIAILFPLAISADLSANQTKQQEVVQAKAEDEEKQTQAAVEEDGKERVGAEKSPVGSDCCWLVVGPGDKVCTCGKNVCGVHPSIHRC